MSLQLASTTPKKSKLCIVLDIDETLIHCEEENMRKNHLCTKLKYKEKGKDATICITKRPYLDEFLNFCTVVLDKVCVWSAADSEYVHCVVNHIFKKLPKPHVVYTYDHTSVDEEDNVFKPLKKICNNEGIDLKYTLLIDDNEVNCEKNQDNAVKIKKYLYSSRNKKGVNDEELKKLMGWIWKHKDVENVTNLNKENVFDKMYFSPGIIETMR